MKSAYIRRRYRRPAAKEPVTSKKDNQSEQQFFGETMHEPFFKPAAAMQQSVQRKCADCEKEDKVQRAPEKKEEEKVMKKEEKKEEKVQRLTDKKEEDKKVQKKGDKKEEEKVMKKEEKKEEEKIHKKEGTASTTNTATSASNYIGSINSKGQSMDAGVQSFYENRIGADFSDVKIHTGKEAADSAKDINAQAYAYGNHIVFNEGKYQPETSEGKHLLAHELTHVVQQGSKSVSKKIIQRKLNDGHDLTSPRFAGDLVLEGCFDNERTLQVGSKGGAVIKLQQALVDAGFPLIIYGVDGDFGSETETAVRDFQHASSITVDGIVGPQTMGSIDALFPPTQVPPPPTSKVCGPDISPEIARIWAQIQSDFASWSFLQKESACRYLVQPYIPGSGANINAFDTLGLFQATTDWMRTAPYHPPCGVPGPVTSPADPFDPAYIDPNTCSSTVQAGSDCWLSGTVNYGTYGIMMKLCSDWTFILKTLPPPFNEMGKYHELFSPEIMMLAIYLYKEHYRNDDSLPPIKWALATYFGGAGGTASGGDRPNCQSTCPISFGGPSFKYTWEPTHPRSSFP